LPIRGYYSTPADICRQLKRKGLWETLTQALCRLAASRIQESTLLILDLTDVSKKSARRMEYLARVHDGSEDGLANGYWTLQVVGAELGKTTLFPLYNRLYSQRCPEFRSGNEKIEEAIETVSAQTQGRGVWVVDRGGDRGKLLWSLAKNKHRFLIRLRQDLHLICRGQQPSALEIAASCPTLYQETVVKEEEGQEKVLRIEFGFRTVFLPDRDVPLSLVVVKGFGQEPLMLVTNLPIRKTRKSLWRAVEAYITRWKIEETIRFIKQCYQLENIRLLTYIRLQKMMALVMAVAYFTMAYLGLRTKLRVLAGHVLRAVRRIFGIPEFRFYALAKMG